MEKQELTLIQPNGVECIHDYIKLKGISIKDVEKHKSKEYEYKRCEGGGSFVRADFYIIEGNFYTNWDG